MVRLLYSSVVIGVRWPCRNPSVTWLCFEGADKVAEGSGMLVLWPRHAVSISKVRARCSRYWLNQRDPVCWGRQKGRQ